MTKRTVVLAATFVTLASLVVPLAGASAQATPARPDVFSAEWCGNQAPPCVVSASRNGVAITTARLAAGTSPSPAPLLSKESTRTATRSPGPAPQNETNTIVAFQGEIGDWQQWPDPAQWNHFDGLDQWTNVELTEIPPQITGNPLTISEELGNSHELNGQVFEGFWYGVLPNSFLVDMGINDPSTLTSAGISASVGTGTVTVTPGPASTEIAITGITFSPRMVHIKRGTITPNAPTGLSTRRASATVAYPAFRAARPRVLMSGPTRAAVWPRTTSPVTAQALAHR